MMPKMNGYELIRAIHAQSNIPILMLSAKSTDNDKILGLKLGADGYLTKSFNPLEIIVRVKANLRRFYELNPVSASGGSSVYTFGPFELDTAAFSVCKNGVPVALTATEYKIFLALLQSPGRIFTKAQLYEKINGAYFESDENTMMVHISKLREKIEDDPKNPRWIKTVIKLKVWKVIKDNYFTTLMWAFVAFMLLMLIIAGFLLGFALQESTRPLQKLLGSDLTPYLGEFKRGDYTSLYTENMLGKTGYFAVLDKQANVIYKSKETMPSISARELEIIPQYQQNSYPLLIDLQSQTGEPLTLVLRAKDEQTEEAVDSIVVLNKEHQVLYSDPQM